MARPVRIRSTYTGDRSKLSRLEEALLKDHRLGEPKKSEILVALRKLVSLLMEADIGLATEVPAESSRRRRRRTDKVEAA